MALWMYFMCCDRKRRSAVLEEMKLIVVKDSEASVTYVRPDRMAERKCFVKKENINRMVPSRWRSGWGELILDHQSYEDAEDAYRTFFEEQGRTSYVECCGKIERKTIDMPDQMLDQEEEITVHRYEFRFPMSFSLSGLTVTVTHTALTARISGGKVFLYNKSKRLEPELVELCRPYMADFRFRYGNSFCCCAVYQRMEDERCARNMVANFLRGVANKIEKKEETNGK